MVLNENNTFSPAPGYALEPLATGNYQLVWKPGATCPQYPHIKAAPTEGLWFVDPGYAFVPSAGLRVAWKPGETNWQYPHITAAETEGSWHLDDGYQWVTPAIGDLRAVWNAGSAHPKYANVIAAAEEGTWQAAPGYSFVKYNGTLYVCNDAPPVTAVLIPEHLATSMARKNLAASSSQSSPNGGKSLIGSAASFAPALVRVSVGSLSPSAANINLNVGDTASQAVASGSEVANEAVAAAAPVAASIDAAETAGEAGGAAVVGEAAAEGGLGEFLGDILAALVAL